MPRNEPCRDPRTDAEGIRQQLIDDGDVLALLAWMRSRSVLRLPPSAMDDIAKAIRSLERRDVGQLVEVAYSEIIGLTTTLLIRYQLHVERRLAESDSHSGNPAHVPCDLIDEDWLPRIERTTRFLMELTTTRERVRHVARLNDDAKNASKTTWQHGNPMDTHRGSSRNGKATRANGRLHCPESSVVFP